MQSAELLYETRQTDRQALHPIDATVNTTKIKIRQNQDALSYNK